MSNLPQFKPEGSYDPNDAKEYCSKSLYEQLQEQKNLKQKKFEEENSFKNSVKMYNEDDLEFINEVHRSKMLQEVKKATELKALIELAKQRQAEQARNSDQAEERVRVNINSKEDDKIKLLKSILKRKRQEELEGSEPKSARIEQEGESKSSDETSEHQMTEKETINMEVDKNNVLPGMEAYETDEEDGSDSNSSDSSASSSDVDVGTFKPLIKRLTEKIKKNA